MKPIPLGTMLNRWLVLEDRGTVGPMRQLKVRCSRCQHERLASVSNAKLLGKVACDCPPAPYPLYR